MSDWQAIAARIGAASGQSFHPRPPGHTGGGCISSACTLTDGEQSWFVKTHQASRIAMFEAEAEGLDTLADSNTFKVPRALCTGTVGTTSFIAMEYLDLGQSSTPGWRNAGERLAELHRISSDRFGWKRNNTIGATPQNNDWTPVWTVFWREQRLGFQLAEAAKNGYRGRLQTLGERLLVRLPALIDHAPRPSLLHGDLWSGNLGFTRRGEPVIYDPAVYYGDREAELAMTELFGGFSADFYAAYRAIWPLDPGYHVRKSLYNLYHVINHLNLFGGGYGPQAERMMETLLAEC